MRTVLLVGVLAVFAIPPVVFLVVALGSGLDVGAAVEALVAQYREPRQNLFVVAIPGLFPLLLLAIGLWIARRIDAARGRRPALALFGLAPILAVLVWVNFQFWPLFLPERTYPGFPHGLEFVIGPGLFAPVGMVVGLVVGWWAVRRP
jgi:hypothetical protein